MSICWCSAQQEAQRAQFYVEKAKQDQRQKIIQAEGEAEAAKMVQSTLHHLLYLFGNRQARISHDYV